MKTLLLLIGYLIKLKNESTLQITKILFCEFEELINPNKVKLEPIAKKERRLV